jgi:hypothetical protein
MRVLTALLFVILLVVPAATQAQIAAPAGISHAQAYSEFNALALPGAAAKLHAGSVAASSSEMPHWLKWGLIGAVGGAVLYTAVRAGNANPGSVIGNAAAGAITGFIVVGGGVALYDWGCSTRRFGGCG